ncbi:MAG: hypothetical protein ACI83N_001842 [Hydrogenophaga sp.]|jgi:hypothetical protein
MSGTLTQAGTGSCASALELLRSDHKKIGQLLNQFDLIAHQSGNFADRQGLIARIGALFNALHGVNEEIVYPLLARSVAPELLQAAQKDHQLLCQQLELVAANGAQNTSADADMQTLATLLRAYFAMEEEKLFPYLAKFDSSTLGQQVAIHRSAELGDQGAD